MTTPHHDPEEEVIMAYLDGELAGDEADQVERHLADCAACAGVADGLRQTSAALTRWDTGPVPAFTPKVRAIGVDWWRRVPKHYVALAAAAVRSLAHTREIPGGPLLVRTARMMITAADFDTARARFEAIVSGAGGFMGNVSVSAATREQRTLSATVRVPGPALEKTLAALRTIGPVTSEALDAEDVTQQSVDLDARLVNARASESRLKMILEQRTGRLSDVLDVEREISRVRGEIERMEAQRKDLDRRIQYASISVTISEEQRASLDLGP
jgi:anti-sigma factor RsiW